MPVHRPSRRPRRLAALLALIVIVGATTAFTAPEEASVGDVAEAAVPRSPVGSELRAGAAVVDASWHVGASQGQYAGEGPGPFDQRNGDTGVDPHVHATTSRPTNGVESRSTVRALVLDDGDGGRWALVTNDFYIPQDLLNQRVATLLEQHDLLHPDGATGITAERLTVSVSHSHSSPFYSSTAWGVWAFQDVFDLRFFEFVARKMADSVIAAAEDLRPARAAAATIDLPLTKRNPEGPTVAHEAALPAGFPESDTDPTLTLLRVDDLSSTTPAPLAHWVVFGRHPEGMEDNGLHTGEYVNTLERILDRERGGVALFSQSDVGTGEIAKDREVHVAEARQEFDDNAYNMLERVARRIADHVLAASDDIDRRWQDPASPLSAATQVSLVDGDAPVAVSTLRFAPPSYRPFPSVSNCRTERATGGDVQAPLVGLPNCASYLPHVPVEASPVDPGVTVDALRDAGVPVPDNYGAPSYTGLQETTTVPIQAIRVGDVAFTVCPCEQFTDQARNIRSRLDRERSNLWFGFDWTANYLLHDGFEPGVAYVGDLLPADVLGTDVRPGPAQLDLEPHTPGEQRWCTPDDEEQPTAWTCLDPRVLDDHDEQDLPSFDEWPRLDPVPHDGFVRYKARLYNDARGWDELIGDDDATPNALEAESEPADPAAIWGNWTHEELTEYGYDLVVPVSMANSYWGYLPPYGEFQARDYYRKALAGLGPHSADFVATRLTRLAATLNGAPGDVLPFSAKDQAYQAEAAQQPIRAAAIGSLAEAVLPVYEARLPADGPAPAIVEQPAGSIERFEIASVSWTGGSNYTDVPHARVERLDDETGRWTPFADGYGEVQTELELPNPEELPLVEAGAFAWTWTATFEAHNSDIARTWADGVGRHQVPTGTYRFVVEGCHRGTDPSPPPSPTCSTWDTLGRVSSYELTSSPFEVTPWTGITVGDLELSPDGRQLTFDVGPDLPLPLDSSNTAFTGFGSAVGVLDRTVTSFTDGIFDYAVLDAIDYPDTAADHPLSLISGPDEGDVKAYEQPHGLERFCFACSFEPWADTGAVSRATVTVVRNGTGEREQVSAVFDPASRRWEAMVHLRPGDRAFVGAGDVVDTFGEINGERSSTVTRPLASRSG